MKKIREKQKNWLKRKSKKAIKKRRKENKAQKRFNLRYRFKVESGGSSKKKDLCQVAPPEKFDLSDNINDTLAFFDKVTARIKVLKPHGTIRFDLSNVTEVSADAIMYLIAIIKNTKRIKTLSIRCLGNAPRNEEARYKFVHSGFYDFVSSDIKTNSSYRDHLKIRNGKNVDANLAEEICSFIHSTSKYTRNDTKFLYPTIIELMTNSNQHAYRSISSMENNWYAYIEDRKTHFKFVFLDTGLGIPNTIRVNFKEKVSSLFVNNDAHLMASAFLGDFRTETQLEHRGLGLPEILCRMKSEHISNFTVVSGKGRCYLDSAMGFQEEKLSHNLSGTLMSWILKKETEDR